MTKLIDVHHGRRLQDYNVRAGDDVAVRVHLTAEGHIHWTVVQDVVARWARKRRCRLQSVTPVLVPLATRILLRMVAEEMERVCSTRFSGSTLIGSNATPQRQMLGAIGRRLRNPSRFECVRFGKVPIGG